MSRVYQTREGDVLDQIAQREYGTTDAVHDLLRANPRVSELPVRLPAGVRLVLPDRAKLATPVQTVRLWGSK